MDDFAPTIDAAAGHAADEYAGLAQALRRQSSVLDTLLATGRHVQALVSGGQRFSVTLRQPDGRRASQAHSDETAARAGEIAAITTAQLAADAVWTGRNISVATLADYRAQWPALVHRMLAETTVRGLVLLDLPLAGASIGSVTVYSDHAGVLPEILDPQLPGLLIMAALALEAAVDRDKVAHLQQALDSNRTIGAALGILMSVRRVTYDQAFELLRATSQNGHRKLRDIAEDVMYVGDLPPVAGW